MQAKCSKVQALHKEQATSSDYIIVTMGLKMTVHCI
jgi:hypothetical protein